MTININHLKDPKNPGRVLTLAWTRDEFGISFGYALCKPDAWVEYPEQKPVLAWTQPEASKVRISKGDTFSRKAGVKLAKARLANKRSAKSIKMSNALEISKKDALVALLESLPLFETLPKYRAVCRIARHYIAQLTAVTSPKTVQERRREAPTVRFKAVDVTPPGSKLQVHELRDAIPNCK